jgi:hypothetical protein
MGQVPLVNFLVAGTQKGGTTALAHFLAQHPGICLSPKKEAHIFDSAQYAANLAAGRLEQACRHAFPNYSGQPAVGDATPIYMFLPELVARIRDYNPAMKWICLLRDPVERAISHYRMERRRGDEPLSFPLAILAEPWRLRRSADEPDRALRRFSYFRRGCYSAQIDSLRRAFPPSQLLFLKTEDLWEHHAATLESIYRFLELPLPEVIPPRERVFAGSSGQGIAPVWTSLLRLAYRREIARTEQRLGWDLDRWRKPQAPAAE